jgi:hypothetical protein
MDSWVHFEHGHQITSIEQVPVDAVGFIYLVEFGAIKYIGKKNFYSERTKHFGKKQLAEVTDKRKKTYTKVIKESDWKTYCGSNSTIKDLLKSGQIPTNRFILDFAFSKQHLTYLEVKYMFKMDVLEDSKYLNDNILGKFYRKIFNFPC